MEECTNFARMTEKTSHQKANDMTERVESLANAVCIIKEAILRAQSQAAKASNAIQLSLYYGIGRYVSLNSRKGFWGTGAVNTICTRLQKELPGLRGFSAENVKKMRTFYEAWDILTNRSPLATNLQQFENKVETGLEIGEKALLCINRPPMATDLSIEEFTGLSFTHHMEILHKTSTTEERIYYIHQAYLHQWNKYLLRKYLTDDLYHHQGNLPNNFSETIPDSKRSLRTISMFKDEYLLDFINVEELGVDEENVNERIVEQAIVRNIRDFILRFGTDFIFMGNQYKVELAGEELFIDLLFFSRELAAMVAVELKYGKFKPAYLGQLCTYLQALDLTVKKPHENPSIGIVLCKEMNKAFVDIVVRNYDSPMGVATYKTKQDMPEKLQKALPDLDKMKEILCGSPDTMQ